MTIIAFEFISGFMLGFELINLEEIYEETKGWGFVVDLGIIRIVVEKRPLE